jgi:hypothetical protein
MTNSLRRFISRAPRYVLRPSDKQMMRYASDNANGPMGIHHTKLVNLSETGAAILIDLHDAPKSGDRLKIELPVPGGDQIAWWATVVRTEITETNWWSTKDPNDEQKVLIAMRFDQLPNGHRKQIRDGLRNRYLEELRERRDQQWLFIQQFIISHSIKIFAYAALLALSGWLLYTLSQPNTNYDPVRGAPWGQRYKLFNFDEKK